MKKSLLFLFSSLFFIFTLGLFHSARAAAPEPCFPGVNPGNIAIEGVPTYDYGPDGLVRFHLTLNPGYWYYPFQDFIMMDENCVQQFRTRPNIISFIGISTTTPVTWKAYKTPANDYNFAAYNDLTGEELLFGWTSTGVPALIKKIQLGLSFTSVPGATEFVYTPGVFLDLNNTGQPTATPALIVPGVLGTELYQEDDLIWPDLVRDPLDPSDLILFDNLDLDQNGNSVNNISIGQVIDKIGPDPLSVNIFKNLIDFLENNSLLLNQEIFLLPYDWRLDLDLSKNLLQQKIEAIKLQTGAQKVDIIAHSMGGLLTKAYLDAYGKDSVRKLIFVGTPHLGAPKAGKAILEGDKFSIPWVVSDQVRDIALNLPSLHELLPSQTYFNQYQGYIKPFSFFGNPSLYDYNQTEDYFINQKNKNPLMFQKAEDFFDKHLENMDLSGIQAYNITGCKTSTQSAYQLSAFGGIGRVGYSSGDETVPLVSSDYISIPWTNKYYVKNGGHSELPSTSGVRQLILDILNGNNPSLASNVSGISTFCNFKGKTLTWKSPVEVHIYSQGKHTGPIENNGIEYGIPGVNYDIINGEKFVFLPTDEGQQYQIEGIGESQGTFDLLVSEIDNGNPGNTQVFNDVSIATGTPISLDISETSQDNQIQVNSQALNSDSQLTPQQAEDLTPPETTATISGTAGNNGWHKSDVQVTLTAADDLSGVLETLYSLDNQTYASYQGPISLITEGIHTLQFYSTDNAGNNEAIKTLEIKIDKQAPEFTIWFDFASKAFKFSAQDNLDSNPQISCTSLQCRAEDQAGNTPALNFKQTKVFNLYSLVLSKINYNGVSSNLTENLFTVGLSGKNLQNSGQAALIKKQQIAGVAYAKDTNQSKIVELQSGSFKTYVLSGLHLIKLKTNKQNINVKVE